MVTSPSPSVSAASSPTRRRTVSPSRSARNARTVEGIMRRSLSRPPWPAGQGSATAVPRRKTPGSPSSPAPRPRPGPTAGDRYHPRVATTPATSGVCDVVVLGGGPTGENAAHGERGAAAAARDVPRAAQSVIHVLDGLVVRPGALSDVRRRLDEEYAPLVARIGMRRVHTWIAPAVELVDRPTELLVLWEVE